MLSAPDAAALCRGLEEHGVGFWLIGGWGVDALLHRQTRPHKDLDVLVRLADLGPLRRWLDGTGTIDGSVVPCVSVRVQRALHTGYDLPDGHRADLELLRGLV